MKILYNKNINDEPGWFEDNFSDDNYTDKRPPDMSYIWDKEMGDWVKPAEVETDDQY